MTYTLLLTTHVSMVLLSRLLCGEGVWMLQESDLLQATPVRTCLTSLRYGFAVIINWLTQTHTASSLHRSRRICAASRQNRAYRLWCALVFTLAVAFSRAPRRLLRAYK